MTPYFFFGTNETNPPLSRTVVQDTFAVDSSAFIVLMIPRCFLQRLAHSTAVIATLWGNRLNMIGSFRRLRCQLIFRAVIGSCGQSRTISTGIWHLYQKQWGGSFFDRVLSSKTYLKVGGVNGGPKVWPHHSGTKVSPKYCFVAKGVLARGHS